MDGCSIAKASKVTGIPYDNAKAINRTYLRERRIHKINYRLRYQKKTLMAYSTVDTTTNNNQRTYAEPVRIPEYALHEERSNNVQQPRTTVQYS